MSLRSAVVASGFAALAVLVGFALHTERKRSLQAIGDLETCLFGEPLGVDERASDRYRALELGRPPVLQRLSTEPGSRRIRFVPEQPIAIELDWPGRCARDLLPLVDAPPYRGLSRALATEARTLHEAIGQGERPPNLDAFWGLVKSEAAVRPRGLVAGPSWSPVRIVLHGSSESFALPCPLEALVAAEWGAGAVRFGDCEVVGEADEPLSRVRSVGEPSKAKRSFVDRVGDFEVPGGRGVLRDRDLLWIDEGSLHHRRVTSATSLGEVRRLASATRFESCLSGAKRHVLAYGAPSTGAPGSLAASVALLDERGPSAPIAIESEVPHFAGRVETAITHSRPRLSCGAEGARVAFAWSTWVDQKVLHQLEIWRCDEKSCSRSVQRLELPTLRSAGCGFCAPDLEPASVESPEVIDLGDAVLLAWSTGSEERVRVAPLAELVSAGDVVLVAPLEEEPRRYSDRYVYVDGATAVVGLSRHTDAGSSDALAFRVDARGVRALARP